MNFTFLKELRQSNTLAPLLFLVVLEGIIGLVR